MHPSIHPTFHTHIHTAEYDDGALVSPTVVSANVPLEPMLKLSPVGRGYYYDFMKRDIVVMFNNTY